MEILVTFIIIGIAQTLIRSLDIVLRQRATAKLSQAHRAAFLLYFANAFFMASVTSYATGFASEHPYLLIGIFSSILCLGPAYRMYFRGLIDPDEKWTMHLHFAPALLALVAEVVIILFGSSWVVSIIPIVKANPPGHFMSYVVLACTVHFFTYVIGLFRRQLRDLRNLRGSRPGMFTVGYTLGNLLLGACICVAFVTSSDILMLMPLVAVSALIITISLMNNRHPDFFDRFKVEYKKNRYENSLLEGVDLDTLGRRLEELMVDEQVYREYDLNIKTVAQMLEIPRERLSQFVNQHLGVDFRNYVNRYRIEEAKSLLTEQVEHSVLRICYMVGFQSKSSFNQAFRRQVGQTPSAYREQALQSAS